MFLTLKIVNYRQIQIRFPWLQIFRIILSVFNLSILFPPYLVQIHIANLLAAGQADGLVQIHIENLLAADQAEGQVQIHQENLLVADQVEVQAQIPQENLRTIDQAECPEEQDLYLTSTTLTNQF